MEKENIKENPFRSIDNLSTLELFEKVYNKNLKWYRSRSVKDRTKEALEFVAEQKAELKKKTSNTTEMEK